MPSYHKEVSLANGILAVTAASSSRLRQKFDCVSGKSNPFCFENSHWSFCGIAARFVASTFAVMCSLQAHTHTRKCLCITVRACVRAALAKLSILLFVFI